MTVEPTTSPTTTEPTNVPTLVPTRIGDRIEFCNICRDATFGDLSLSKPDATIASFVNGGISITCGFAQFLGSTLNVNNGPVYTLTQCAIAQSLAVGTCGCPNEPTIAPSTTAAGGVTTASPQPTDGPPGVFCLICPNGNMATGTGLLGSMLCQDVDTMARDSLLTDEECLAAQTRAAQDDDPCGCSGGPAPAPVGTLSFFGQFVILVLVFTNAIKKEKKIVSSIRRKRTPANERKKLSSRYMFVFVSFLVFHIPNTQHLVRRHL